MTKCWVCDDQIVETPDGWIHVGLPLSGTPWNHDARPRTDHPATDVATPT